MKINATLGELVNFTFATEQKYYVVNRTTKETLTMGYALKGDALRHLKTMPKGSIYEVVLK